MKRLACPLLLLPVLLVLAIELTAQTIEPCSPPDQGQLNTVFWARDFMLAFYPELKGRHLIVGDDLGFGEDCSFHVFTVTLEPFQHVSVNSASHGMEPSLHAKFRFRTDDLLSDWHEDAFPAKVLEARKLVNEHLDWTEKDIDRALLNSGVRFLSKDKQQLMNSLPLRVLDKLFGQVRVTKLEFWYRDHDTPPNAILTWHVEFAVLRDGKPHHSYVMALDPFSGKPILIQLDRSPIAYQNQ